MGRNRNAFCSFCRKSYRDAGPLVEGPNDVYICGECIDLSQSIIDTEKRRRNPPPPVDRSAPNRLRAVLDKLVDRQESAKSALIEAADRRLEERGRVLLVGSSRSSALLLAKAIAFALGVPFAAGHWQGLTKPGHGHVVFDLLAAASYDLALAPHGIAFVGGLDDVAGQETLADLWRTKVFRFGGDLILDLRGVLFVCSGTFAELEEAIASVPLRDVPISSKALVDIGAHSRWATALTAFARVSPLDEKNLERLVPWLDFGRTLRE
jgi:ATP-dependent protease Clp ATPase subunit